MTKLSQQQLQILHSENFWQGGQCLKYGLPWLTPQSVCFIDNIFSKNNINNFLEIGSGGSTIFFKHRVKNIFSFERDAKYCTEPYVYHVATLKNLKAKLKSLGLMYDGILLDSHMEDCNRQNIFKEIIGYFCQRKSIFIIDNYASYDNFPDLKDQSFLKSFFNETFMFENFDHPKWAGGSKGTKIIYEKSLNL